MRQTADFISSESDPSKANPLSIVAALSRLDWVVVLALQLIFFVPISIERFAAGDEGYYLMASKLVMNGRMIYTDFFYPQMPLLPFVYGFWMKIAGYSWESGRIFTAITASIIGSLLFLHSKQKFGKLTASLVLILFCFSSMVFPWFTVVKTYALSSLLLLLSYLAIDKNSQNRSSQFLLSGFLLGLATDTRLFFIATLPAFFFFIYMDAKEKKLGFRPVVLFCLGLGVALTPCVVLAIRDFASFQFNNLGYHLIRSGTDAETSQAYKIVIAKIIFGLRSTQQFFSPQWLVLFFPALFYPVLVRCSLRNIDLSYWIFLILLIVSFLPTPAYIQYFSVLMPFMLIPIGALIHKLASSTVPKSILILALAGFLFGYLWASRIDINRYTVTGQGVLGVKPNRANAFRIATLNEISGKIDSITKPGETVLAFWPGYLTNTHTIPVEHLENHFGLKVSPKLTKAQREKFKISSMNQVESIIASGSIRTLVLARNTVKKKLSELIRNSGYNPVAHIEDVIIYSR